MYIPISLKNKENGIMFCECPQCKCIANLIDNRVYTDEEIIECLNCGYHSVNYKEHYIPYKGYGVINAEYSDLKPRVFMILESPINAYTKEKYINNYFSSNALIKDKSYFYIFDFNTNKLVSIKGTLPKSFNDTVEEYRNENEYYRQF